LIFFWYHGFNGNKFHAPKVTKSILIGAHLDIIYIYIYIPKKKIKKKTTMLGTYENMGQFWLFKSP